MANLNLQAPACSLVIFGASGDLTNRKLIPALHSLDCEDRLAPEMKVLGVARSHLSNEQFRDQLCEGVAKFGRLEPLAWENFSQRLFYMPGGYDDPQTYRHLAARLDDWDRQNDTTGNRLFYLAIPPELYPVVVGRLGEAGLNRNSSGWTRIIIEKPFGRDLSSAGELNDVVHAYFGEEQVYRIDHYLGKETVQNIMAFRFANYIFEEMWGRNYVDHVQITAAEDVGVERRGGYYDQAGVLRDMVQNHLLQLVALTAMEPPAKMNAKALRDEKVKVLQAVHPLAVKKMVMGQYRGYRQERGVAPDSATPTYVALKLFVDNWRWQGVPFYLRTGKGLARKNTEITLQFKRVPHLIFTDGDAGLPANQLSICIQPDEGMHLRFALKVPGAEMRTSPVNMDFNYQDFFGEQGLPDAYERLLLDALHGDASLFARSDEILRAWELITPILKGWDAQDDRHLCFYDLGSWGPEDGDALISRDGRLWSMCCDCDPDTP
jgi:glucose-6-phosphate 1-dehydrogenase